MGLSFFRIKVSRGIDRSIAKAHSPKMRKNSHAQPDTTRQPSKNNMFCISHAASVFLEGDITKTIAKKIGKRF